MFLATQLAGFGAYTASTATGNDSFTKLLLHCDGSNGSGTFTDSSSLGATITANGGATISTAQSKFGGASGVFSEGSSQWLSVPDNAALRFGTGAFTIDFWVYFTSLTSEDGLIAKGTSAASDWTLYVYNGGGGIKLYWARGNANLLLGTTTLTTGQWYHVEVGRSGTTVYMFLNGSSEGTVSDSQDYSSTDVIRIARSHSSNYASAYFDEIRVSVGTCRHTAGFTPPTEAYG